MPPAEESLEYLANLTLKSLDGTASAAAAALRDDSTESRAQSAHGIPLSEPLQADQRPRVLLADDDRDLIAALDRSWHAHYEKALDLRFWLADNQGEDLLDCLDRLARAGWRPDVVVQDINLAHGGKNGLDYLKALREKPGCAAVAVVLATALHKADMDAGQLRTDRNVTNVDPTQWLERAKPFEPEAILYGKAGSAGFLARVGESAPTWRQVARRRAWQRLLDTVAGQLDGNPEVKAICQTIVDYARTELDIDHAFVRWRDGPAFKLEAHGTSLTNHVAVGDAVSLDEVPLLQWLGERKPVVRDRVDATDLGRFSAMAGRRFLGIPALLEDRLVGFITLFRDPDKAPFDALIDGNPLGILARLLAAALGRMASILRLRNLQQALLSFANDITAKDDRKGICESLATFLHREIHGGDDNVGKVSVRLLDYGTGLLVRQACVGTHCDDPEISIFDPRSIYAWTVMNKQSTRCDDVQKCDLYRPSAQDMRSELCAPLLIGAHAIGAVNLEHTEVGKYKPHDQTYVESAATLAAQALEDLHSSAFAESLLAFVEHYGAYNAEQAEAQLREILHQFCGYSVLVTLEPGDRSNLELPWRRIGDVDLRLQAGDREAIEGSLETSGRDPVEWNQTWVAKLVKEHAWARASANYTEDKNEFKSVVIASKDGAQFEQEADAVLWLGSRAGAPRRLLLLLWALPPFLGRHDVEALARFARLFSALQEREDRIRTLLNEKVLGEQAAAIGHVMQHFRHRLTNETGAAAGYLESLEAALEDGDLARARNLRDSLARKVKAMANSFNKAQGYVKDVDARACRVADIVTAAQGELAERLSGLGWETCIANDLACWTDPTIAALILYSLLENAADALAGRPTPAIRVTATAVDALVRLQVSDNGPGVPEPHPCKLMQFGFTTKPGGLGSALAFARLRARALGGELRLAPVQPTAGATFELDLPADRATFEGLIAREGNPS